MTSFARFKKDNIIQNLTMQEIEDFIGNEKFKIPISDAIYNRYYNRYLKSIFFISDGLSEMKIDEKLKSEISILFNREYKSGFNILSNSCIVIESITSFLNGTNYTATKGDETFNEFFLKAKGYNNNLQIFYKENFYKNIRCALLHQGETYSAFKIRRNGELYNKKYKIVNASLFAVSLKEFLDSYRLELQGSKWDSSLWDNCRKKIRYIIANSK